MKQQLLLLISTFFLSTSLYSQVANTPSDLSTCDDDYDGLTAFDLTNLNSEILGNQSSMDFSLTYHVTQTEAESNDNQIADPTNYVSSTATIYARVTENASGNFGITSVNLVVHSLPIINLNDTYFICNNNTILLDASITSPNLYNYIWSTGDTTPILNINFPGVYTITVTGLTTGCAVTKSIQILDGLQTITEPLPYEICDDNNDGFETFDLSSKDNEIIGEQINVIVTYHSSQIDAENNINPLPNNYVNTNPLETLYVRVENTISHCYSTTTLDLIIQDCRDEDSDGVINSNEDINGNGNLDDDDTDKDGTPDYLDDDDDGDKIDTADELIDQSIITTSKSIGLKSNNIIDTDDDKIENYLDDDDDDDGVLTKDEDYNNNGTPLDDDTNNNSIPDYLEKNIALRITGVKNINFLLYPNPTKDVLYINTKPGIKIEKIQLYSITGKLLFNKKNNKEISLKHFPKGIYFLNIISDNNNLTKKIIKN